MQKKKKSEIFIYNGQTYNIFWEGETVSTSQGVRCPLCIDQKRKKKHEKLVDNACYSNMSYDHDLVFDRKHICMVTGWMGGWMYEEKGTDSVMR